MMTDADNSNGKLSGSWSQSGVTLKVESHATLRQLESGLEKILGSDCGGAGNVNVSGLQLLHVWMQCIHLRGAKPTLASLPFGMQQMIRKFGLENSFVDFQPEALQKAIPDNHAHSAAENGHPATHWGGNELPDLSLLRNDDCFSYVEACHQRDEY